MGEPLCEQFYVREFFKFVVVMKSLVRGRLSRPPLFLSLRNFVFCPFFFAPAHWPRGYNLKNPSVAREAQLLITVGHGGVWSVRMFKA